MELYKAAVSFFSDNEKEGYVSINPSLSGSRKIICLPFVFMLNFNNFELLILKDVKFSFKEMLSILKNRSELSFFKTDNDCLCTQPKEHILLKRLI